jgi:hypothetical protein
VSRRPRRRTERQPPPSDRTAPPTPDADREAPSTAPVPPTPPVSVTAPGVPGPAELDAAPAGDTTGTTTAAASAAGGDEAAATAAPATAAPSRRRTGGGRRRTPRPGPEAAAMPAPTAAAEGAVAAAPAPVTAVDGPSRDGAAAIAAEAVPAVAPPGQGAAGEAPAVAVPAAPAPRGPAWGPSRPRLVNPDLWAARRAYAGDACALGLLFALALLFYRALVFTDEVASDPLLFRLVYPYRQFLAEALRDGRLALWNPLLFTGVPFLADPQAGVLYPLNLVLRWLDAPQAVALSIVVHALIAATGTYLFLRHIFGVVRPAAFTAAVAFGFGGFLAANAVEPNVVEAAAWLPWVVLGAGIAVRGPLVGGIAAASVALALQVFAGAPQVSALTLAALGVFLAVHALAPAARGDRAGRWPGPAVRAIRCLLAALLVPALAAALSAAQILPSRELYARSLRSEGLTYVQAVAGALPPGELVRALLPGLGEDPERPFIAYTGIVVLGLAAVGLLRGGGAGAAFAALLALLGLGWALGDAAPLQALLHRASGGHVAFAQPTQGLLLVSFAAAVAAGLGVHVLWPGAPPPRPRGWRRWVRPALGALALLLLVGVLIANRATLDLPSGGVREIWLGLGIVALDVALVLPLTRPRRWVALLVVTAVVAELLVAGAQLPFTRTAPAAAFSVQSALAAALRADGAPARVARVSGVAETDPPPAAGFARYAAARAGRDRLAPDAAMLDGIETVEGLGTVLLPPRAFALALGISPPVAGAGEPHAVGDLPPEGVDIVAARLGARYVLGPPRRTVREGDVAFVLGPGLVVPPGATVPVDLPADRAATGLALLTDMPGAPPEDQPVVELVAVEAGGGQRLRTLVAGADTADPGAAAAGRGTVLSDGGRAFISVQPLGRPAVYRAVTLRNLTGSATLYVYALSLLDDRTGGSFPVLLNETLRPLGGADPAVYENLAAPPRAALVHRFEVEPDVTATLRRFATLPAGTVVLDRAPDRVILDVGRAGTDGEQVRVARYTPERVEVLVTATTPGILVLRDAAYPGWRALLDGEPTMLLRADGLFRAVAVPAGTHSVVFEFRPASLRAGAAIAVGTALLLAAVTLVALWPARPAPARPRRRGAASRVGR